jgi:hypothetical protein
MWRRYLLAAVLVLLQLPALAVLAVGWLATGGVFKCLQSSIRYLAWLKSFVGALGPRLASTMKTFGLVLAVVGVFAIATFWVLSHVDPHTFGSCHPVALQIGDHATARQCEPYTPIDFGVPMALVLLLVFIASDGDMKIGGYGWTLEKKTREAREKINTLQKDEPDIARRAAEFEQTVDPARE